MKRVLKAFVFLFTLVVVTGLTGALYYFHFTMKPQIIKGFIAKAAPPPATVAAVRATHQAWVEGLTAVGSARAYQGIDISSQLSGIVTAIHFGSGRDVPQGAALFDLDTSVERADLKSNLATLRNAEISLQRQQMLMSGGNTAKANLDSALAARDQAAAAVERVKATIAQKTLVAPFAGRLGIRKVDVGQFASAGMSLITLQELDPIYVDFPLPEQTMGKLHGGETVEVKVDAYPGEIFRGSIDIIDARIAAESRSVLIRAVFRNPDKRLLPGMFADVRVLTGTPHDVVVVPRTAVTFSLYGDSVFVLTPAPTHTAASPPGSANAAPADPPRYIATRRFVRTGDTQDDSVAILEGVAAGELVVSQGQIKLQNGATVVVDPNARLVPPRERPKE